MIDIEKKAYEVYPEELVQVVQGWSPELRDKNYYPRQGYIRCSEEYESLPKIHGWVARDTNGDLALFVIKPERCGLIWTNFDGKRVMISSVLFPEITWESEPVEVELLIRKV